MKIQRVHLCLDCDELHEGLTCPVCGSGAWCYPFPWIERAADWELAERVRIAEEFMEDLCG